jgi:hypothetical protein
LGEFWYFFWTGSFNILAMFFVTWASTSVVARDPLGDTRISDAVGTAAACYVIYALAPAQAFDHGVYVMVYINRLIRGQLKFGRPMFRAHGDILWNWGTLTAGAFVGAAVNDVRYGNSLYDAGYYTLDPDISWQAAVGYAIPGPFFFLIAYYCNKVYCNAKHFEVFPDQPLAKYKDSDAIIARNQLPFLLAFIVFLDIFILGDINGGNLFLVRSLGGALVGHDYSGFLPKLLGTSVGYTFAMIITSIHYWIVTWKGSTFQANSNEQTYANTFAY